MQGSETDTVGDACHQTNALRPMGWEEAVGGDLVRVCIQELLGLMCLDSDYL